MNEIVNEKAHKERPISSQILPKNIRLYGNRSTGRLLATDRRQSLAVAGSRRQSQAVAGSRRQSPAVAGSLTAISDQA